MQTTERITDCHVRNDPDCPKDMLITLCFEDKSERSFSISMETLRRCVSNLIISEVMPRR